METMQEFLDEFQKWLETKKFEFEIGDFGLVDDPKRWTMGIELDGGEEIFVTVEQA